MQTGRELLACARHAPLCAMQGSVLSRVATHGAFLGALSRAQCSVGISARAFCSKSLCQESSSKAPHVSGSWLGFSFCRSNLRGGLSTTSLAQSGAKSTGTFGQRRGVQLSKSGKLQPPGVSQGLHRATAVQAAAAGAVEAAAPAPPATPAGGAAAEEQERPTWKAHLDFKWMRDNKEAIARNIVARNAKVDVEKVVELYEEFAKKTAVSMGGEGRGERRGVEWGGERRGGEERRRERRGDERGEERRGRREAKEADWALVTTHGGATWHAGKRLKDVLAGLEAELALLTEALQAEGRKIPNVTHPDVPVGGEELAVVRKLVGEQRAFDFPVSGNKFYYLKNEGVLLEMALVNWALSQLAARGFTPLSTPDLVRSSVVEKCGFQPRGANTQVRAAGGSCHVSFPRARCPPSYLVSSLVPGVVPRVEYTPTRRTPTESTLPGVLMPGIHFSKVEIFVLARPEDSDAVHEELISIEEELFASLGLHFKTLDMSTEDLGAPAYRKYDIEAWMPGLAKYGEARRLNIRYRPSGNVAEGQSEGAKGGGKKSKKEPATRFVHTLNATACAVPRMIVSILENFQEADGSVTIPEPLRPFMGGISSIKPKVK
eukprot:jgi/Mesen1/4516/ME000023S03890